MDNTTDVQELPLVNHVEAVSSEKAVSGDKFKAPTSHRKYLLITIGCFLASLISAAIATFLYVDIGEHKDPDIAPLFLVWLVVSYALSYVLGLLAYLVYRNLPKKVDSSDVEEGKPLKDLQRRDSKLTSNTHRRSDSAGSPFPIPHFKIRGRMTRQDYQQKRTTTTTTDGAAVYDDLAITPVKSNVNVNVPKSPSDSHPNPLASFPIMASPPPNFPSAAVLRAQASAHSGFSGYSHTSGSTTSTKPARDPFSNSEMEVKSASSISLTSAHAREVSVARKDSLKKIREATKRRAEGY
ncbi:hypothetical protein LTR85_003005 [Meristemomyces frigidus]|nr:hypothetical protein LTR85_003005 [Meristemomyces frigidus]